MGKRGGLTAIIPVSPGAADTQCLRLVNQVVAVVASEAQVWIADPCIASPLISSRELKSISTKSGLPAMMRLKSTVEMILSVLGTQTA